MRLRIGATVEERRALWRQFEEQCEATLEEHRELWEHQFGVRVSIATMIRAIRRLGWTHKQRRWEPPSETKRREMLGGAGWLARSTRAGSSSWTSVARTSGSPRYGRGRPGASVPTGKRRATAARTPRSWRA
jgi:hypothetical protein